MFSRKKNKGEVIMEEEHLQIRFEGESSIGIETLTSSLSATVETLKTIADNVVGQEEFCKFKVNVFKEGSFVVDIIKILYENRGTIIDTSYTILTALEAILSVRQHLNGNKPSSIDKSNGKTEIKNNNGNVYIMDTAIFNFYTNDDKIESNLARMCDAVSKENERKGIEFNFDNNCVKYNEQEVKILSVPMDVEAFDDNTIEEDITTILTVHKPDLIGNSKWDFYMQNQSIKAQILDNEFKLKLRDQKVLYTSNTRMKVQLMIRYKVNDAGLPDSKKKASYSILKVYQVDVNGDLTDI